LKQKSLGFTERDLGGYGLIVKRLVIEYQEQVYHGDVLTIKIGIVEISRASVRLVYVATNQDRKSVMEAETLIVFFDYEKNKIKKTPEFFYALVSA
jgi:acyl-CoA thioester hydrolase